ncbi:DMT family transporter [Tabrizicola sp.]|uniref:DMT family transporter n=1 Tax=Tabrizicola sp. TaxID=2005166 RepID=UPI003F32667B
MGDGLRHAALMLAAGVGIPLLAALNANLGQRIGSPVAAGVVLFAVAFATALVVLLATGGQGALARVPGQPPVLFLAGCLVAFYILSITFVAPRFGLANAILFVLLGQLVSAAIIDATGLMGLAARPVSALRMLGLGLMALGVVLSQRG